METDTGCRMAYTNLDSKAKASEMARTLIEKKCVACVNIIGPVESVYEWNGQIETGTEWTLMMKCTENQLNELKTTVVALHDYELPEFIVLPVIQGHEPYLRWIHASAGAKE